MKAPARLVREFLSDYDRLGDCGPEARRAFIDGFLRCLKYQALALVTWLQQEW